MRVVVVGKNGQLGWELQKIISSGEHDGGVIFLSSADLDISAEDKVFESIEKQSPQVIINAAAYTAVDKAEDEESLAYAVNADGAANLAKAAKQVGARFIHVSTDFVFDGKKSTPYLPEDVTNPTGVYGKSKLAGEKRIVEINGKQNCAIVRTAWVYSSHGNNFVKTMLRLMAERDSLGVVADQVGTPTWARGLAEAVWHLATSDVDGIFHWTDAGVSSWYDFAVAIQEEALSLGLLDSICTINPIGTADYPLPAKRPAYSVLDKTLTWEKLGMQAQHWRVALRNMFKELTHE